MTATTTRFPIDLDAYKPLALDPTNPSLTDEQRETLRANIQLCRSAIVFLPLLVRLEESAVILVVLTIPYPK